VTAGPPPSLIVRLFPVPGSSHTIRLGAGVAGT